MVYIGCNVPAANSLFRMPGTEDPEVTEWKGIASELGVSNEALENATSADDIRAQITNRLVEKFVSSYLNEDLGLQEFAEPTSQNSKNKKPQSPTDSANLQEQLAARETKSAKQQTT